MNQSTESDADKTVTYEKFGILQAEINTHIISWTLIHFTKFLTNKQRIRSDFFQIPVLPNYLFYMCLIADEDKLSLTVNKSALSSRFTDVHMDIAISLLDVLHVPQISRNVVMPKESSSVSIALERNNIAHLFRNNDRTLIIKCALSIDNPGHVNILLSEMHKKKYGKAYQHMTKLSSDELRELLEVLLDGEVDDRVIISVSDIDFHVHRNILCTYSPVFAAMFSHETVESKQNHVHIKDVHKEIVGEMLKFMYTGSTSELSLAMAMQLYIAADKYAMSDLKMRCSNFLTSSMTKEFVLEIITMADQHADDELKVTAMKFLVEKASDVIQTDDFLLFLATETEVARSTFLYLVKKYVK